MVGSAQTGTGKTAAFALPCIHRLGKHGACRALALAPTRELAIQIEENFNKYGKFLDLRMALLYGGVKYGKQLEQLQNEPDVIVATPGRLLDHLSQGNLSLKKIEILILDEVDRMLDMGFIEDVTKIIQKTPRSRQTLLFSATIPDTVRRLSAWALNNPAEAKIDIKISAADTVSHALYPVPAIQKFDLLIALLEQIKFENLIIFFQTRRGTDKISHWLTEHGQVQEFSVFIEILFDLNRQFPGGGKGEGPAGTMLSQPMNTGKGKSRGLSCSGLGRANQVSSFKNGRAMSLPGYMPNMNFFRLLKLRQFQEPEKRRDKVRADLDNLFPVPGSAYFGMHWAGYALLFIIASYCWIRTETSYPNQPALYLVFFRVLEIALALAIERNSYWACSLAKT